MDSGGNPAPKSRWSWWLLVTVLLVVPVGVTVGAYWLLSSQAASFEVLRTAATVGIGAGGLITLGTVLHRQRLAHQSHQLDSKVAEHNRVDALEKRAQELFVKAVEQLGHDKAAVRIGALHALDDLGQKHELRRRAVMDVWCAYLRMPPPATTAPKVFTVGVEPTHASQPGPAWQAEELQVRATVQRLIAEHLRDPRSDDERGKDIPAPDAFWEPMDIDLTGAHLHNVNLRNCRLRDALFSRVEFSGDTWFSKAQFAAVADFSGAQFAADAGFSGAKFAGDAAFDEAEFAGNAGFSGAKFAGHAWFRGAKFAGDAGFSRAEFAWHAAFGVAEFAGDAAFSGAKFAGNAGFNEVKFAASAWFRGAEFAGDTGFSGAEFAASARFSGVEFAGKARFDGAEFLKAGEVVPSARFYPVFKHKLPEGWRAAPTDGEPGRLLEWNPEFLAALAVEPDGT